MMAEKIYIGHNQQYADPALAVDDGFSRMPSHMLANISAALGEWVYRNRELKDSISYKQMLFLGERCAHYYRIHPETTP